jgi:hypothetical protein
VHSRARHREHLGRVRLPARDVANQPEVGPRCAEAGDDRGGGSAVGVEGLDDERIHHLLRAERNALQRVDVVDQLEVGPSAEHVAEAKSVNTAEHERDDSPARRRDR